MLTPRETELIAIGAAIASNCIPCVEHHIPKAKEAGVSDDEVHAAIRLAERVKQAPAMKVSEAALALIGRKHVGMEPRAG
jgi:4-carboxymuconolactone decarboxylase